ncbi:enoyl-CoA hydratase/isomerase family protein [Pseudooceanicola nanhaiensis]|uniref:enoyl-CoA hydratase/isomerase family protein n=1 Tax=Pseudooceanicola nanhaiensis TaxID=375761 RepID=UPI001CD6C042|nr:enoyl-CoA hydratase/isomerase family protein [Pseudooceanicola nanhaiensis]MCA0919363.1 enoyl-CoA hydratase/isomerase family protein [Pseudooceanicola nanhaiensis]
MTFRIEDRIAIISLANPPINALTPRMRNALAEALDRAEAEDCRGVVIEGTEDVFASGLTLNEYDDGLQDISLAELNRRVETFPKPVVVRLAGLVSGGGLELALAAHWRVGTETVRLALPDLGIGLIPGAGGTQRLPRLVGGEAALNLILSRQAAGPSWPAFKLVVDEVHRAETAHRAAVDSALRLAERGDWPLSAERTGGLEEGDAFRQAVEKRRAAYLEANRRAELEVVNCVEAALLMPFEAGLELEATIYEELVDSNHSAALRHARKAERRAASIAMKQRSNPLTTVGVAYAGPLAAQAVAEMLVAGLSVKLADPDQRARETLVRAVTRELETMAEARSSGAGLEPGEVLRQLQMSPDMSSLAGQSVLVEGAPDTEKAKRAALSALSMLGRVLGGPPPILSLTHHLDVAALAPAPLKGKVAGLSLAHRSFPAPLAEFSAPKGEEEALVNGAVRFATALGRRAVRLFPTPQAASASMVLTAALLAAADALTARGIEPGQVDAAMRSWGMRRGPYQMITELPADVLSRARIAFGDLDGLSLKRLAERGGVVPEPSPEDPQPLVGLAPGSGEDGAWTPVDVRRACLAAVVNTGTGLLDQGLVARPLVLDAVALMGLGYAPSTGGPMKAAELRGLFEYVKRCRALAPLNPLLWTPHPLLVKLQREGVVFDRMNG